MKIWLFLQNEVSITILLLISLITPCLSAYFEQYKIFLITVMYAFEQALLALSFYPNIWYQAALFLEDRSRQLFDQGVSC